MEHEILRTVQAAQEKAALAMMADAKDGVKYPQCHPHGRAGGTNPVNYGWLQAFLPVYDRMIDGDVEKERLRLFIELHVEDAVLCFWQTMANQNTPPGEYTVIENGICTSGDWDILRHVDVAGYCDVALHPDFAHLRSLVEPMAVRWGQWIMEAGWEKRTRETLRMGLPLNSLVAIYELTGDFKWLANAVSLFCFGWGDHVKRETVDEETGLTWTTWDSGYPWEKRGGYMGHILDWPWYEGEFGQACLRLWPHADATVRALISDRILKITEKYVNRTMVPAMLGDFAVIKNTPLHGGTTDIGEGEVSWLTEGSDVLEPEEWLEFPEDREYRKLRCLYWRTIDGEYQDTYFYDDAGDAIAERLYHPRTPPYDPKLARDHFGIPDLLYARYLLTMDPSDRLLAIWMLHDYVGFCNQSGHIAFPKKKFSTDWYHDAAGKSRLLAWRFLAGWHLMRAEMKK